MSNLGIQKQDYNFFALELDNKEASRKKRTLFIVLILVYLILVAGAYFLIEFAIKNAQKETDSLEAYLVSEEVVTDLQVSGEKKLEIVGLQQYDASLQNFAKYLEVNNIIGTAYMNQVTSAIPEGLFFDSISMSGPSLLIQGTAPTRQLIAEYLNNMQALDLFKDVHVSTITSVSETIVSETDVDQTVETTYTFAMSCQLKDVDEE